MKKNILMVASGSFMALLPASVLAQDVAPGTTTETTTTMTEPTAGGHGATVVREDTTTTTTTTDETGAQTVTTETANSQSTTTPSGNRTTVERMTDAYGDKSTTVTHEKGHHGKPDMAEKPGKPR